MKKRRKVLHAARNNLHYANSPPNQRRIATDAQPSVNGGIWIIGVIFRNINKNK